MRPFTYRRVFSLSDANASASEADVPPTSASIQFLAGGTNILDLMKLDVMRPETLLDINDLAAEYSYIRLESGRLLLGAFAHMSAVAEHATVIHEFPVLAQALQLAASTQLRNMATLAGNVLQRTRCNYFRDVSYRECNKRAPGSGCAAMQGVNRKLAVLGVSDHCIAHYPGDFAIALIALDADVLVRSRDGVRTFPVEQLHRLPGDTPHIETILTAEDVILEFSIPVRPWFRRSLFLKIRDRESYEFALASAAIALDLHAGVVREARIALGGLVTKPWRAQEAEAALRGGVLDEALAEAAARQTFSSAITHGGNDFKPQLGQRTLVRALLECAAQES
jgi:xanthine dehydrogenase YagS FAD-binding subunit